MALITVTNTSGERFAVPPPLACILAAGDSADFEVSLDAASDPDILDLIDRSLISLAVAQGTGVPDAVAPATVANVAASVHTCTLSVADESSHTRTITGQVVDANGDAVEAVTNVSIQAITTTTAQTAIADGGSGAVVLSKVSGFLQSAVMTTTSAGAFQFVIAEANSGTVCVCVLVDGGKAVIVSPTFAG